MIYNIKCSNDLLYKNVSILTNNINTNITTNKNFFELLFQWPTLAICFLNILCVFLFFILIMVAKSGVDDNSSVSRNNSALLLFVFVMLLCCRFIVYIIINLNQNDKHRILLSKLSKFITQLINEVMNNGKKFSSDYKPYTNYNIARKIYDLCDNATELKQIIQKIKSTVDITLNNLDTINQKQVLSTDDIIRMIGLPSFSEITPETIKILLELPKSIDMSNESTELITKISELNIGIANIHIVNLMKKCYVSKNNSIDYMQSKITKIISEYTLNGGNIHSVLILEKSLYATLYQALDVVFKDNISRLCNILSMSLYINDKETLSINTNLLNLLNKINTSNVNNYMTQESLIYNTTLNSLEMFTGAE